jgi:hypothetical protein
MRTFDTDLDAPLHVSPELVLVSPPDVARAAREALAPPPPEDAVMPVASAAATAPVADPRPAPTAPVPAPVRAGRRGPGRALLSAAAIALVAGGFFAGREFTGHTSRSAPAAAPTATAPVASAPTGSGPAETAASTTSQVRRTRPALPVVSWKPRRGIRRYRFDLVTGRVAILTIITDEPRAQLPLSWPNAGRRRHLVPGRYAWTVRAATGASRVIARGTVTIPRFNKS